MPLESLGKFVIIACLVLLALGTLLLLAPRVPLIGRLPGDFLIKRDGFTFYFPLVTGLILSLVLTIILNLLLRFFKG